jgi:hypothetical protein
LDVAFRFLLAIFELMKTMQTQPMVNLTLTDSNRYLYHIDYLKEVFVDRIVVVAIFHEQTIQIRIQE